MFLSCRIKKALSKLTFITHVTLENGEIKSARVVILFFLHIKSAPADGSTATKGKNPHCCTIVSVVDVVGVAVGGGSADKFEVDIRPKAEIAKSD